MTSDDDKEPQHKLQASEPGLSASPDPWRCVPNGTDEKFNGNGFDAVDIEGHTSALVDIDGAINLMLLTLIKTWLVMKRTLK
jgi:hypothetical protein